MKEVSIRNAEPEDAKAIIELNNYMWRKTYKDLLPMEILDKREKEKQGRIIKLKERLARDNTLCFVVEKNEEIVGWAGARLKNDKGMEENISQIDAMYFKENLQGVGISLELAKIVARKLLDMGHSRMITGCLVGNKFNSMHIALGGKKIKELPIEKLDGAIENIYFYGDINTILKMTIKDAIENVKRSRQEI